jgi:hypothetical protein
MISPSPLGVVGDAGAVPVGVNVRISRGASNTDEVNPAVAYDSDSNRFLTVWEDDRKQSARGWDIYGQLVTAAGDKVGPNFRISRGTTNTDEKFPAVAYDSHNGRFLVVWQDGRKQSTRGWDIYGQLVTAAGDKVGPNFRISRGTTDTDERHPDVTHDSSNDRFLVVWEDNRKATHGFDIYGQQLEGSGSRMGANFRISRSAEDELDPVVASADGWFLVVWHDNRKISTRGWDVYGQLATVYGIHERNFRISRGAGATDELYPAIAADPTNEQFLVVWEDYRKEATHRSEIYGQRVNVEGSKLGGNFRISRSASNELDPAITADSSNEQFLVVWEDSRKWVTRGSEIYGQRLGQDGSRLGSNFRISRSAANETEPAVAHDPTNHQFLTVWGDDRKSTTRGEDIYGALYVTGGTG